MMRREQIIKIGALALIAVLIANMLLFALRKITSGIFWLTILLVAIVAWIAKKLLLRT